MKHKFPRFISINEVLPHIEGFDGFNVVKKDGYTVIDYAVDIPGQFDGEGFEFRRECRGLIFDLTGRLIRRPYHKFFNVNQNEENLLSNVAQGILDHGVSFFNKEDGSLISPFMVSGEVLWGTRRGVTDVSLQMESEFGVAKMKHLSKIARPFIMNGKTLCFEYVSPENKIVLDYAEPRLILTGVRDTYTGEYHPVQDYAAYFEVVKKFDVQGTFEAIHDYFKNATGIEGTVGRLGNGHMFKIKGDEYVLLHKSKERVSIEREIWRIVIEGKADDFLPLLDPKDQEKVHTAAFEFENLVSAYQIHMAHYALIAGGKDRKWVAAQPWDAIDKACFFKYLDGVPIREFITARILASTVQEKKFNEFKEHLLSKVGGK